MSNETPAQPVQPLPPSGKGAGFVPPSVEELNRAIPQYEFVSLLGAGGMGAVYKARQPTLDRFVAVKILPPLVEDEMGFAARFRREAQAMAKLSHPHIIAVYDFGETTDGKLYFVMEFVEGSDLHRLIQAGQLTNKHFFSWIPQICGALQYAHKNGIIHRDIKPANILIDTSGRVKIADFGLAKRTGPDQQQTALTVANVSMGTPDYAAPEQLDGASPVDARADIYSVGVLMYHMLTGTLPRGAFPMPTEKVPELDPRIDDLVVKAMQSNPDNRFQNAEEITTFLTEILSTEPPVEKAPEETAFAGLAGFPRKWVITAAAGIALLVTAVGIQIFLKNAESERAAIAQVEKAPETEPKPMPAPSAAAPAAKKPESLPPREKKPPESPPKTTNPEPAAPRTDPAATGKPVANKSGKPVPKASGKAQERPPALPSEPKPESPLPRGEGIKERNLAQFKSKLGARIRAEGFHRTTGGVMLLSRDGQELPDVPLARVPDDLPPLVKLAIGQAPRKTGAPPPFAIALHPDGTLSGWGDNSVGQLDFPEDAVDVVDVTAGAAHALALKGDGAVLAWGQGDSGETEAPTGLKEVTRLAAGHGFSVALLADGTVRAWGRVLQSEPPADLSNVKAIAAGYDHVLCLRNDGTVATWGGNDFGQLDVPEIADAKAIACTYGSSLALIGDGRLVAWGASRQKELPSTAHIESFSASGDAVVLRDEQMRWFVISPQSRTFSFYPLLRHVPAAAEILFTEDIIFVYRPHRLEMRGDETGPDRPPMNEDSSEPMPDPGPPAETEAGRRIAELQKQFEEAYLEKVNRPYEASVAQLNEFYLNALEKKQTEAAEAHRLEEALGLRAEAELMRAGNPMPESDPPGLEFSLLDLRAKYREQIAGYKETRDASEADLLDKYDKALQAMQDQFTEEQKLDDALEVKSFRERRE